jgi:hypothetical protein
MLYVAGLGAVTQQTERKRRWQVGEGDDPHGMVKRSTVLCPHPKMVLTWLALPTITSLSQVEGEPWWLPELLLS